MHRSTVLVSLLAGLTVAMPAAQVLETAVLDKRSVRYWADISVEFRLTFQDVRTECQHLMRTGKLQEYGNWS